MALKRVGRVVRRIAEDAVESKGVLKVGRSVHEMGALERAGMRAEVGIGEVHLGDQNVGIQFLPIGEKVPNKRYPYVAATYVPALQRMQMGMVKVPEEFEGQGLGKELLEHLADETEKLGGTTLSGGIINPKAVANRVKVFGEEASIFKWDGEIVSSQQAIEHLEARPPGVNQSVDVTTRLDPSRKRHSTARNGLPVRSSAPTRFPSNGRGRYTQDIDLDRD